MGFKLWSIIELWNDQRLDFRLYTYVACLIGTDEMTKSENPSGVTGADRRLLLSTGINKEIIILLNAARFVGKLAILRDVILAWKRSKCSSGCYRRFRLTDA
ncbi:hypothetical protein T02_166 [Trichinella nativa]|uniref:Uncharacterized protein n=1 Tax=Trichinella nativa TaxID=6335 RepID=A0A0V1L5L0_9BILA|nr:hypothetical protein T02_166 [Trichinella nativa]